MNQFFTRTCKLSITYALSLASGLAIRLLFQDLKKQNLIFTITSSLIFCVVAGIILGFLHSLYELRNKRLHRIKVIKMNKHFDLKNDEEWVKSETCTYQNEKKEFVDGIFCLTTKHIFYTSTSKYFEKQSLSIPLSNIQSVEPHLTLGISPNGIKITTKHDEIDYFIMSNQESWLEQISHQL